MKKLILILSFIVFCFIQVFAQNVEYTRLKGSTVSLIIPKGFVESDRFAGIINLENNASILFVEMETGSDGFDKIKETCTKEKLATRNIKLITKEAVTVDNKKGILVIGDQTANGEIYSKIILALNENTKTLLATGTFYKKDFKAVELQLKQLLLNLKWNPQGQISATDGINFSITETKKLKISLSLSKSLMLTLNGDKPPVPIEKPLFVISESISETAVLDAKSVSENQVMEYDHVKEARIIENNPIVIDGVKGFETIFVGNDRKTGKKMFNYQVTLFPPNTYFVILGLVSFENKDKYIEDFKEVAKSFKLKK